MEGKVQSGTIIVSFCTYYVNHYHIMMSSLKIRKNSQGYFSIRVSHELHAEVTQFRERI